MTTTSGGKPTPPLDLTTLSWWALAALRRASWKNESQREEIDRLMPAAYVRYRVAVLGENDEVREQRKRDKLKQKRKTTPL